MPSAPSANHARRWWILAIIGIAQLMVVLDATIVNIALPSAQDSLDFSDESRQWIVTAYALAFGSLLLLGGRLGDLFGRKRVFVVGLAGFAIASAIGGAAQSFEVLVATRALQGVFGALLAPGALSLLSTTFTNPAERGKAFGIFGAIAGGGGAAGLLLGGVLTEYLSWRWCLYVNLLFAIPAAIGGSSQSFEVLVATRALQGVVGALLAPGALSLLSTTFTNPSERGKAFGIFGAIAGGGGAAGLLLGGVLTEYLSWRWCLYVNLLFAVPAALGALALLHDEAQAVRPKLDLPGTIVASAGLFGVVYGFSHAETTSWTNPITIAFLAGSIVLLALFVVIERRVEHPLLPMRVVLDRNRGGAYLAVAIAGVGMFGVFLFLTYYLQQTLGYSPVTTGVAFLPMIGCVMIVATIATAKLLQIFGPRPLVTLGMVLSAVGMVLLAQIGVDSSYAGHVLPPLLIMGAGMGLIMAPSMNIATLGVAPDDSGVASAMVNTGQQVGGSLGTALLSTLAASATTAFMAGKTATPDVAAQAAVHGYTTAFWWSAGIFLVGAVVSGALYRRGVPVVDPAAEPVVAH
jgi:EmrB/QacA subfamily drug resistance transporter